MKTANIFIMAAISAEMQMEVLIIYLVKDRHVYLSTSNIVYDILYLLSTKCEMLWGS